METKPTYAGVYSITNISSGKRYIGSSGNLHARWKAHLKALKAGKHHCVYLQNAWNKHGADQFEFQILEQCLPEGVILVAREQVWIDKYKKKLYNSKKLAEPWAYSLMNDEERKQYSEQMRKNIAKFWDVQPTVEKVCELCGKTFETRNVTKPTRFCGRNCRQKSRVIRGNEDAQFTCVVCKKEFIGNKFKKPKACSSHCSKRVKSKFTDSDIVKIIERAVAMEAMLSIAKSYDVDKATISNIVDRKTWSHVPISDDLEAARRALVNDPNRLAKLLSKLTDDQVREIRKRIQAGEPYSKIAPDYNVSVMTISSIKTGRRYNDVKDDAA
jgi:group I intron endonuclease